MIDASSACCYDTLTDLIEKEITEFKGGMVKVICSAQLEGEMRKYCQERGHKIIDQIEEGEEKSFIIELAGKNPTSKPESRNGENCMICGGTLDYLSQSSTAECFYCGKAGETRIICPESHFLCDECHGKDAYQAIKEISLSSDVKDPISLAEELLSHPSIPMLGCENALVVPASLMVT